MALGPHLPDAQELGSFGADEGVVFEAANSAPLLEEDIAAGVSCWAEKESVWALLAPSTEWGRQVASRVAAKQEAGLVGDAIGLDVGSSFAVSEDSLLKHRLVADKPAFGGQLVAEIFCSSPLQMATLRTGVLPLLTPRESEPATISAQPCTPRNRIKLLSRQRDDNSDELANAEVVIGIGQGVDPADYPLLQDLSNQLGATLCATRKVTDKSWMPRARQVGITGHTISPRLYIAVGLAGNFNPHCGGAHGRHYRCHQHRPRSLDFPNLRHRAGGRLERSAAPAGEGTAQPDAVKLNFPKSEFSTLPHAE